MRQVARLVRRLRESRKTDTVHDLRVAIRRCRSFASLMEEIDGDDGWRSVRHRTRPLFRALGELRELHVHFEILSDAMRPSALRARLQTALKRAERAPGRRVSHELKAFELHTWRDLRRNLGQRCSIPPGGLLARALIADRYARLRQLHRHAASIDSAEAWHAVRVGLKRFRYALEAVWPDRADELRDHLERLQQLLGRVHDLDMLDDWLVRHQPRHALTAVRRALRTRRAQCMSEYASVFGPPSATFREWGRDLPRATVGARSRLRAMVRSMGARRRRTAAALRSTRRLLGELRRARLLPDAIDSGSRLALTVSWLDDIAPGGRGGSRRKRARKALLAMPPPAGWHLEDWVSVASAVGDGGGDTGDFKTVRHVLEQATQPMRRRRLLTIALLRIARLLTRLEIPSLRIERDSEGAVFKIRARHRKVTRHTCAVLERESRLFALLAEIDLRVVSDERRGATGSREGRLSTSGR